MAGARIVFITGAAAGIGRACALRFAAGGDRVIVSDLAEEAGRATVAEIDAAGGSAVFHRLDSADEAAVGALVATIERDEGPIEAMITCAGILQNPGEITDMPLAEADRMWEVNYRGVYLCCRAVAPRMAARGRGSIVNMHSTTSTRPYPLVAYGTGKAALMRLSEMLAAEFGPSGVRVNGVAPGPTMTENMRRRVEAGQRDPAKMIAWNAIPEIVQPADVAEAIHFLCSDDARAVTGVTLPVDYGWQASVTYKAYPK
jgi:NAD(P)-dependent dehydrogenase (short-subunit alcohol dehydrogenase family)